MALVFTLTGCSSLNRSTSGTTTLYWWRSQEDASEATLTQIVNDFESSNPKIKVEVVLKDPRTFEQEAVDALAAHQTVTNAPDILSVRAEDLPKYVPQLTGAPDTLFNTAAGKKGTGEDSVQYVNDLFLPAAAKSIILDEPTSGTPKVYGLPLAIDTLALYYNKTLIDKTVSNLKDNLKSERPVSADELKAIKKKIQTPPKTWTELTEIIPYLRITNGADISQAAIAMGTSKNVERSYDILQSIMLQNGTQLTSDDLDAATFNLSQSAAVGEKNPGEDALKFYLRFSNPQDSLYTWNDKMPNSVDAFINGQTVMMFHYASTYRFIINESPTLKNSIDVAAMPQTLDPTSSINADRLKTMSRMWVETVPSAKADANRQQAAWTFVQYITNKAHSKTYLNAMKLPSALKDGTDKAKFPAFNEQKTYADTWYKGHKALTIDQLFITMIDDAYSGRKSTKEALDATAAEVTSYLQASKVKWGTRQQ